MAAFKLRTISFADKRIKDLLKAHFVLVWSDFDADGQIDTRVSFTQQEVEASPLGFGSRNVKMFVARPDGGVLSQIGGFWSPEYLRPFLELSRTVDPSQARQMHERMALEF